MWLFPGRNASARAKAGAYPCADAIALQVPLCRYAG